MNIFDDLSTVSGVQTESGTSSTRQLGKYSLVRPLGRGGMGEVWLAEDTVGRVKVALKMLPPELRYSEEAQEQIRLSYQRVHGLQHPAICNVKDLVLDPQVGYFLVMEYFDGVTLSRYRLQYAAKHGSFPVEELCRVLQPVAEALDHAHREKIVHRDIKPTNILVSEDGERVKVIDFQLASEIKTTVSRMTRQQADTSGTYPYLAPEQFLGGRANPRTDLYALGMVAFELLAGDLPYEAQGWDFWKGIVTDPRTALPAIPGLNDQASSAIKRCLSREDAERQASCSAFVQALQFRQQPHRHLSPRQSQVVEVPPDNVTIPEGVRSGSDQLTDAEFVDILNKLKAALRKSSIMGSAGKPVAMLMIFLASKALRNSVEIAVVVGIVGAALLVVCNWLHKAIKEEGLRALFQNDSKFQLYEVRLSFGVMIIAVAQSLKDNDNDVFNAMFTVKASKLLPNGFAAETIFGKPVPSEITRLCNESTIH